MKKRIWNYSILSVSLFVFILDFAFASVHQVDNNISEEDKVYITKFVDNIGPIEKERNFEDEIRFIKDVQKSVLSIASVDKGLPYNEPREPKNLYENKVGLCFDRSRVIEKILRLHGFETRHIFVFSTKKSSSTISAFFTRQVQSHAISEILTKKGWIVVDSNDFWISLDANNNPVSIDRLQEIKSNTEIDWIENPPKSYTTLRPFSSVYGLYLRHGRFYPPYNPIPDVNYSELIQNFY